MNSKNKNGLWSRWYYWAFVPFSALAYAVFCWWFALEAWGYRGETKPWWFDAAFILTAPSMFLPPYIGTLLCGAIMGFGIIKLIEWIRRANHRPLEKKEQGQEQ